MSRSLTAGQAINRMSNPKGVTSLMVSIAPAAQGLAKLEDLDAVESSFIDIA
ncbi:hypothetical protein OIT16_004276 [Vibrio vulnificus]|nr:hypothetical protein [Vibrio vulnificus]